MLHSTELGLEGARALPERSAQARATALLERVKAGCPDAFETLMTEEQPRVFRTAFALLGNHEDAKDATQDVFLRCFRHRGRLDPGRDPAPWLYRITVNVCNDLLRRRSRTRWLWRMPGPPRETAPTAERRIQAEEELSIVTDGLKRLAPRERAVLVLRDIEGHPTKDVARMLGSSEVTVRSQLSRARLKLKRHSDRVLGREP